MQNPGFSQLLGQHPPGIHSRADAGHPSGGVDFVDFSVARLLQGVDHIPPQQLDQKVIQKVRSGTDEDVLRIYRHSPKGRKMGGDGLPQLRDSL